MKRKSGYLAVFALILILAGAVGSAWAYFTTYVEARGVLTISLGDETRIDEPDISQGMKHVVITSDADSKPVYVRAKAFCGGEYKLDYSSEDGKWTLGDEGYYYYRDILYGGEKTSELLVNYKDILGKIKDETEFNVAVIYETTPVLYDEDGNPYADWDRERDVTVEEGGNK